LSEPSPRDYSVVIPARYASSRLPGKPLLDIAGKPMIQHVFELALRSGALEVIIATDDERVRAAAREFGASVHMTDALHESGTARVAQVVREHGFPDEHLIVNVQGDEPLLPSELIAQVARVLRTDRSARVATLWEPITELARVFDPAVVKVVVDARSHALYFSRAPIPWHRDGFARDPRESDAAYHRHVGLYAYRAACLKELVRQPPTMLERSASWEKLRGLHHGIEIAVAAATATAGPGVDTPEDLARVRARIARSGS
jgi:3-deoxy-manno-octulosonate cytidylyltransferase (CMP-KDO synthetase)